MRVIIATDIFGVTEAILMLAHSLRNQQVSVSVVDPYDGVEQAFTDEHSAYQAFLSSCGHDNYVRKVEHAISASTEQFVILGFSAGASAAWRLMNCSFKSKLLHFIGFYPGQIRNHLDIVPKYPCTVIFPDHEQHFSVSELSGILAKNDNVFCIHTEFGHGFMNPSSLQYSNSGADTFNHLINQSSTLADVARLRQLLQVR